ncbi:MAG: SPASM domain-containing protein, partial [Planctomycetes bacterium]|nr:SPASM domain-containing protein [Planctomycetota bacterium]
KYVHITPNGNVEPCVFVHFAKDNIHDKGIVEIMNSDVFKDARSRQPFGDDLRRPCPVIDHPEVLKELVEKYGLFANDGASTSMINEFHPIVCQQSMAYQNHLAALDQAAACSCCKETPVAK